MLIEFRVKNFLSFRDEQVFSMVASSDKELLDNTCFIPQFGKRRLLRSAVMYGANASGKSNFIKAIEFMADFVKKSADSEAGKHDISVIPFLFDRDSPNKPSEFEVTFLQDDVRYQYGFIVDREKVHDEWLVAYPKNLPQKWFERVFNPDAGEYEWYFGPRLLGEKSSLKKFVASNVLFLSFARNQNDQLKDVWLWFVDDLQVFGKSSIEYPFENYVAKKTLENKNLHDVARSLLAIADLGIEDFHVMEEPYTDTDFPDDMPLETQAYIKKQPRFDIEMQHQLEDKGVPAKLKIGLESDGTRKIFSLSGIWFLALTKKSCVLMDEMDTSLHPTLVRFLVEMFHDSSLNECESQLIFNTHDTTLLDQTLFRRDQIWFVEKDDEGASHIYPLLDFSPRKDEALIKGYMMGRYGAVPFPGQFTWGNGDGET